MLWSSLYGDIAFAESCRISVNVEMIETAATSNGARQYVKGKSESTISISGLIGLENDAIDTSIDGWFDQVINNTNDVFRLRFEFTKTGQYKEVPCLSSSFEYNSENTGYASYSVSFQGTGDITQV